MESRDGNLFATFRNGAQLDKFYSSRPTPSAPHAAQLDVVVLALLSSEFEGTSPFRPRSDILTIRVEKSAVGDESQDSPKRGRQKADPMAR